MVLESPAVGIKAFLQGPREGGFRGQGVVHRQDGAAQVLGPALQVGLRGGEAGQKGGGDRPGMKINTNESWLLFLYSPSPSV